MKMNLTLRLHLQRLAEGGKRECDRRLHLLVNNALPVSDVGSVHRPCWDKVEKMKERQKQDNSSCVSITFFREKKAIFPKLRFAGVPIELREIWLKPKFW